MEFLAEGADEGFGVYVAQGGADFRYGAVGVPQQMFCPAQAQDAFPVVEAQARGAFNQA